VGYGIIDGEPLFIVKGGRRFGPFRAENVEIRPGRIEREVMPTLDGVGMYRDMPRETRGTLELVGSELCDLMQGYGGEPEPEEADGIALDAWAKLAGVKRADDESLEDYRDRLMAKLKGHAVKLGENEEEVEAAVDALADYFDEVL
jgi:hypothetical protein